jgi:hypothetical protein
MDGAYDEDSDIRVNAIAKLSGVELTFLSSWIMWWQYLGRTIDDALGRKSALFINIVEVALARIIHEGSAASADTRL